jgi:hypothetical protein
MYRGFPDDILLKLPSCRLPENAHINKKKYSFNPYFNVNTFQGYWN